MSETQIDGAIANRYLRNTGLSFIAIMMILLAGYFLYTRYDFDTLYAGLDIEDASIIAAELDRQGVRYNVGKGGDSILVQENKIEEVRLAVYGADGPTQGLTGFELFNESEMGLTDFAQKIKFQRAIQGELSRTIMMIEGVKKARVHVAIPERSVFRSQRTEPKAAITLISDEGVLFSDESILGIQRLVASSIPGLSLRYVTIVDKQGQIISRASEIMAPVDLKHSSQSVSPTVNDVGGFYQVADLSITENSSLARDKGDATIEDFRATHSEVVAMKVSQGANMPEGPLSNTGAVGEESPMIPALNSAHTQTPSSNVGAAIVKATFPQWVGPIILSGLLLIGLFIFLIFRRPRTSLSAHQRSEFAEELSQALRENE